MRDYGSLALRTAAIIWAPLRDRERKPTTLTGSASTAECGHSYIFPHLLASHGGSENDDVGDDDDGDEEEMISSSPASVRLRNPSASNLRAVHEFRQPNSVSQKPGAKPGCCRGREKIEEQQHTGGHWRAQRRENKNHAQHPSSTQHPQTYYKATVITDGDVS